MSKSSKSIKTNKRLPRTIPPTIEELKCLIMWPQDTTGYLNEYCAILSYLLVGTGRMNQIASFIEDLWNDPAKVAYYKKMKSQHFKQCGWKEEND